MDALIVCGSARRDGNSAALARAMADGLAASGHAAEIVFADAVLSGFLRDCRTCRRADGTCSIEDGFRDVFLDKVLPAQGLILATPVYWYGMSAQAKAFFDRMFCYVAASYPRSAEVAGGLKDKRVGLALASEETFPTVGAGIVHQVQEYCRYTRSTFVGVVHGHGNARGEVARDPGVPLARARSFGASFFDAKATDYQIDTPRSGRVWG
jgi:NAD(P)H-dependent FMN reductase